jgi:NAD(P)-dependent dehydrogenase (short-subunit alcohol dehydrogenase family)
LITGVGASGGVDIARSFVEAGARVILQCDDTSPETEGLAALLFPVAAELSIHTTPLSSSDQIVSFARTAVAEFGGLDMVVNVVALTGCAPADTASLEAIEQRVSDVLLKACLVSRVAANRMNMMMTEGTILTVATLPASATKSELAFAQVLRATLAAMTRGEAEAWAGHGIRFCAVAPDVLSVVAKPASGAETDVAQLAIYLAAGRGAGLSGVTLELGLLAV